MLSLPGIWIPRQIVATWYTFSGHRSLLSYLGRGDDLLVPRTWEQVAWNEALVSNGVAGILDPGDTSYADQDLEGMCPPVDPVLQTTNVLAISGKGDMFQLPVPVQQDQAPISRVVVELP
jgi:hypothetical protein